MPTTALRLKAAAVAFASGTPSQVAAAVKDLQSLIHEIYCAATPGAQDGHFHPPKQRSADATAVLAELGRLEAGDSWADYQRALASIEAFIAKHRG